MSRCHKVFYSKTTKALVILLLLYYRQILNDFVYYFSQICPQVYVTVLAPYKAGVMAAL